MPLVRIDLIQGKSSDYRGAIGEVIYEAMLAILNVPKNDRFQVITEHPVEGFLFDPTYLGIQRSSDCIFIQLTLNVGRLMPLRRSFRRCENVVPKRGSLCAPTAVSVARRLWPGAKPNSQWSIIVWAWRATDFVGIRHQNAQKPTAKVLAKTIGADPTSSYLNG